MKPHISTLINAFILIVLGVWGYTGSQTPSLTALIPVMAGFLLLLLYKGIKRERKYFIQAAIIITFLILAGLLKPLSGALSRSDMVATGRVSIMMLSTLISLIILLKPLLIKQKK